MLSNTATPYYYGKFRDAVLRGDIPVNKEISMEMNRIDGLIANPDFYYDDCAINGFVDFCENELTLTDGSPVKLLDTFKLWAEELLAWFYFEDQEVPDQHGRYQHKKVKKRLVNKQYLIIARSAAKSLYLSYLQQYFLVVDTTTTAPITTAPTMKLAAAVMPPIRTAISRARCPVYTSLPHGSI